MTKEILLTQGMAALVDDSDYEWLAQWKWCLNNGYAGRRVRNRILYMHREIANTPSGLDTDHIDGNKLNNCRGNLRICSHAQNTANAPGRRGSSIYQGVYWNSNTRKWQAYYSSNGRNKYIGLFSDEREAALARDRMAKEIHGAYARLNFPEAIHE